MEVIQGYADSPQIVSSSDDIFSLFKNVFPNNKARSFQEICGPNLTEVYFIVLSWYGRPIAMTCLSWNSERSCWYMYNFGVRKARRKEGYGRQLLALTREFAADKELGCYVHNDNVDARCFFLKNGAIFTDQWDDSNHFWVILS